MAYTLNNAAQIVEIANSAYPTAVTTEVLTDLSVKSLLENSGYTILSDGTCIYTGSIEAASAAGSEIVGNTVMNTSITGASSTSATINATVPAATTTAKGTKLLKGALYADVNPVMAVTAIVGSLGYEVENIKENPEFWTDLSDALLGIDENQRLNLPPGVILDIASGCDVIMRAIEDGGIKAYCRREQIERVIQKLYDDGEFNTGDDLIPDITEPGTYSITAGGADFDVAMSVIGQPMPTSDLYATAKSDFNNRVASTGANAMVIGWYTSLWSGGGFVNVQIDAYRIPDGANMSVTVIGNNISVVEALPNPIGSYQLQYNIYDGTHRQTSWTTYPVLYPRINGMLNNYNVKSTLNTRYVVPSGQLTPDPNADVLTNPDQLSTLFADWLADQITTTKANPEDGTTDVIQWLPLRLWDFENNPDVGPNNQTAIQDGTLPGYQGDPEVLPEYIQKILNPNITLPNFRIPEVSDGDTPIIVPPVNSLSSKLYTVYNPSNAALDDLGDYLWDASIIRQLVELFTNNPMDAIISLHQIYATPITGTSKNIILGILNSGVSAPIVTQQYISIDCGSIAVSELYQDARDYTQVQCDIFLPFIGMRSLDCHDVIGCNISIKYHVDVYTGSCLAEITINKQGVTQTLYTFEGNCSVQIPLTAADRSRMIQGIVAATTGLVSGGVGAMVSGAAVSALGGAAQSSIHKSSGFSGNAGAMGCKRPYLVITRHKSADAAIYAEIIGNPTNKSVLLKDCAGFTRVSDIHIDIPRATEWERAKLAEVLHKGIYL